MIDLLTARVDFVFDQSLPAQHYQMYRQSPLQYVVFRE